MSVSTNILGIETSCDETAAAIITISDDKKSLLVRANDIASSLSLHAVTGGVIPETAAREQIKYILPVISQTLINAFGPEVDMKNPPISAIAVTYGPGLIGSLLVGVETARTLSFLWNKPIIPVNHMLGHIYANWLSESSEAHRTEDKAAIAFPAIALVVSGGHTDLVLLKDHGVYEVLGGTRDDAAGEAFDKIGRLLGLPYPAGATIAKLAEKGNPKRFPFPRPMLHSDNLDFSFSGLKTAVLNTVKPMHRTSDQIVADICASVQQAIVDVLVYKTIKAAQNHQAESLLLGGGVAANEHLRKQLQLSAINHNLAAKLFVPEKSFCTDNAAMIAAAAVFYDSPIPWKDITADPELYY